MLLLNEQRALMAFFYGFYLHVCHSRNHSSIFFLLFFFYDLCHLESSDMACQICVMLLAEKEMGFCIGPNVEKTEDMPPAKKNNGILGVLPEPQCCWHGAVFSLSKGVGIAVTDRTTH